MPEDRGILHLLQQEFVVDQADGVRQPVGMVGRQLEVRVHVITAAHAAVQNVITALNRAGMEVEDTVYEALACSESVLRRDERELGAAVIDKLLSALARPGCFVVDAFITHKHPQLFSGLGRDGELPFFWV